ncbi:hypothetical protein GCM10027294_43920 [Marinactinospora endophytica]
MMALKELFPPLADAQQEAKLGLVKWAAMVRQRDRRVLRALTLGLPKAKIHELTGLSLAVIDKIEADNPRYQFPEEPPVARSDADDIDRTGWWVNVAISEQSGAFVEVRYRDERAFLVCKASCDETVDERDIAEAQEAVLDLTRRLLDVIPDIIHADEQYKAAQEKYDQSHRSDKDLKRIRDAKKKYSVALTEAYERVHDLFSESGGEEPNDIDRAAFDRWAGDVMRYGPGGCQHRL